MHGNDIHILNAKLVLISLCCQRINFLMSVPIVVVAVRLDHLPYVQ
jgi:hypothetical protein